jgi:hypothetical protein
MLCGGLAFASFASGKGH